MPGLHTFYDGNKLLEPLANELGFEVDKLNLVVCQLISIVCGYIYYNHFGPTKISRNTRLAFPFVVGILLCYFCYGSAIKHILSNVAISYALLKFSPPKYVHKLVFLFSMGYLIFIHWFRWYLLLSYSIDVTGPIMVIVQKTTTLAFSLHDGRVKKPEELNDLQKREAIKEVPSVLTYLSYMLHFQTVLTGPLCFYTDYLKFISGENFIVNGKKLHQPNPLRPVLQKFGISLICLCFIIKFNEKTQPEIIIQPEQLSLPWYQWVLLFYFVIFMQRLQYYYAWVLADAICNLSGFGFSGFDTNNQEKWDLMTNVYPLNVEKALTFKDTLDGWNCTTMHWLRRVAYDRVPKNYRTIATYLLSALWHGFFVGYYMSFITGALFTVAARNVRRFIRPFFQGTKLLQYIYHLITFVSTKFALMYATFPFVTMHLNPGLFLYQRLYFFLHILSVFAIVALPRILPPPKKIIETTMESVTKTKNINNNNNNNNNNSVVVDNYIHKFNRRTDGVKKID